MASAYGVRKFPGSLSAYGFINRGKLSLTANTTLKPGKHSGRVIVLNAAAGLTLTLPAATGSGTEFTLFVGTTVTSNQYRVNVTGDDAYFGVVLADTDADSADLATVTWAAPSGADQINMNGTTQGGRKGDFLRLVDVAADSWHVFGVIQASGAEVTPFATGQVS